jgi:hypothetical protein
LNVDEGYSRLGEQPVRLVILRPELYVRKDDDVFAARTPLMRRTGKRRTKAYCGGTAASVKMMVVDDAM